jgi:glycosyltransferase involved in cell wall biosynthesis
MRIAFVSLMSGLPWGGSEALWYATAMHSLEAGDAVFVSIYDWGKPHEKIELLRIKGAIINFRKRFNPDPGTLEKIGRFIKSRRPSLNSEYQSVIDFAPDIIFISQGDTFDIAFHHRGLFQLLRKNDIPYSLVCHSHSQYGFIPPKEIYPGAVEMFKKAKHVFFISHRQLELTERRLITRIDNAIITYNPLNLVPPASPLTWPSEVITQMALVANISGSKGHDTVIEVLSSVHWKERYWILNIYGDGEGLDYLKGLTEFYGISHRVVFHGYVNHILPIWEKNHLLLVPSAGEGLPISLVEAMSCGRAAVVTDVGGNTELIIEDQTGFIAASPTVASFSAALEKAWEHKLAWKEMGIKAFKKIDSTVDKHPGLNLYNLLRQSCEGNKPVIPIKATGRLT